MLTLLHAAAPAVVPVDTSPEWYETLFAVIVALGTVAAVAVALWTAWRSGKDADTRAAEDRAAFAARQQEERDHDRKTADARWRLDLLLRIAEVDERVQAREAASLPAFEDTATVVALLSAYPGWLPALRGDYLNHIWSDDYRRRVFDEYGIGPDAASRYTKQQFHRIEVRHWLSQIRSETFGTQVEDYRGEST